LRKQKQLLLKIGNKTLVAFLGPSQRNFNVTGEKNSRNSVIKKKLKNGPPLSRKITRTNA
jgi:hypothetical protein